MLPRLRRAVLDTPLLGDALRRGARWVRLRRLAGRAPDEVFADVFRENRWGGADSRSGTGSDLAQTARVRAELPGLLARHGVESLLDVPCGDFHWMRHVGLGSVRYTGGDVVRELVERNRAFARPGAVEFRRLDLLGASLPAADLVLVRDALVHLSDEDALRALRNLAASGSRLLLATTFPSRDANPPIRTGEWRPMNLEAPPFSLPPPLELLVEGCTEAGGRFADKALGLWRLADLWTRLGDGR